MTRPRLHHVATRRLGPTKNRSVSSSLIFVLINILYDRKRIVRLVDRMIGKYWYIRSFKLASTFYAATKRTRIRVSRIMRYLFTVLVSDCKQTYRQNIICHRLWCYKNGKNCFVRVALKHGRCNVFWCKKWTIIYVYLTYNIERQ